MVIGFILSGILAGILGTLGGLILGLPLWIAVILYPVVGMLGSIGFISFSMRREENDSVEPSNQFATEIR